MLSILTLYLRISSAQEKCMMLSSNVTMVNDAFFKMKHSLNDSFIPEEIGDSAHVYEAVESLDQVKN